MIRKILPRSTRVWSTTCSAVLLFGLGLGAAFAPSPAGVGSGTAAPGARDTPLSAAPAARHGAGAATGTSVPSHTWAPPAGRSASEPSIDPRAVFRGLGAWVDLYDARLDPRAVVPRMAASGVRTLYVQTGRSNTPYPVDPGVGRWLVEAHRAGIRVVGWYLPFYEDLRRDLQRTVRIKRFSYRGHRFDGLGIDVEFRSRRTPRWLWNRNVAALAGRVRGAVGPGYPVASITPPPLQMQVSTARWAGFPWRAIARASDAVMLMSYWSDRAGCPAVRLFCAYEYTAANVSLTRMLVGDRPAVHIIGGIGDRITEAQLLEFVEAAKASGADGASIYDVATTKPAWWRALARLSGLGS